MHDDGELASFADARFELRRSTNKGFGRVMTPASRSKVPPPEPG
jgi:hypothetical protein